MPTSNSKQAKMLAGTKAVVKSMGGKIVSLVGWPTNLTVACHSGHEWYAFRQAIDKGHWCAKCAGNSPFTIEQLKLLAIGRNGRCLSEKYAGTHEKYDWECSLGHRWSATFNSVKRGTWCGSCEDSRGERTVRRIFEELFETEFKKVRPDWLIDPVNGNRLELDGYSQARAIAFEHQGPHHYGAAYRYGPESLAQARDTKRRDSLKLRLCKQRGITLIQVPELGNIIPYDSAVVEVSALCIAAGLQPNQMIGAEITQSHPRDLEELERIKREAGKEGYELLSSTYEGTMTKKDWRCPLKHSYKGTIGNFRAGKRCPLCAGKNKGIADAQALALRHGGDCLSSAYKTSQTKMNWSCGKGHPPFEATFSNVQKGHWCPLCKSAQLSVLFRRDASELTAAAKARGGRCLTPEEYKNSTTLIGWECAKGHRWRATAAPIVRGTTWCPACKGKRIRHPFK